MRDLGQPSAFGFGKVADQFDPDSKDQVIVVSGNQSNLNDHVVQSPIAIRFGRSAIYGGVDMAGLPNPLKRDRRTTGRGGFGSPETASDLLEQFVEPRRFELLTLCLPGRCSTN